MPRPIFIRRASSAREIGSCSRTRLRRIWRLISRGVHRVARTKLRVLIFLMGGNRGDIAFPLSRTYTQPPTLFFVRTFVLRTPQHKSSTPARSHLSWPDAG